MVTRDPHDGEREMVDFRARLVDAAAGIGRPLSENEADGMATLFRLLREWNRRMNLTGLKDVDSILRRHFLEPISASMLVKGEGRLVDLGSGNGFPAVPFAILNPEVRLTLVEASEKKSAFLWMVLRELSMNTAQVATRRVCRRADLGDLVPARWITFRGVKVEEMFRGSGPNLLDEDGRLLAFLARSDAGRIRVSPPDGLTWIETLELPSFVDDVVAVLGPA
jgi:16S rRNA (guanine(527)-N(7))-methyltransferase RsmG